MEKDNYGLEVLPISKLTGSNKTPLKQEKKGAVVLLSMKKREFQLNTMPCK